MKFHRRVRGVCVCVCVRRERERERERERGAETETETGGVGGGDRERENVSECVCACIRVCLIPTASHAMGYRGCRWGFLHCVRGLLLPCQRIAIGQG